MTETVTIASYLRELDEELRLKRAPRQRLLVEARDHLRSAADELLLDGRSPAEAEHEAVARFGAAAEVARRFAHAAASSSARTAIFWTGLSFVAYTVTALLFVAAAPVWLRDFPQGAASMLALQVAAVAVAVTAVRALRWRRALILDEERLRLVANGALIATLAVGAGAAAELVVALTRPAAAPWGDAWALIAGFGLVSVVSLSAVLVATANYARVGALDSLQARPAPDETPTLADDIAAVAPLLGAQAHAALRRPGVTCTALALAAFAAVVLMQPLVVGSLVLGGLEATAVVVGYLALGRPLCLRKG
ncbi:MAG: permease prefix domain 1-containing protein [Gaiellaceae bacterium]